MKIAIIGSRSITADIPEKCIPDGVTEIVSGAAKGIDTSAQHYAYEHHILITDIIPEYNLYGRRAPLVRNDLIISLVDKVFVFWDGKSRGTLYTVKKCKEINKPYILYLYDGNDFILKERYPAE